jgi:transposase
MLDIEERFMIKELYRKGVSISDIARQTGRDRKTIRKLVYAPLLSAPKPRQPKPCKLDPYVAYLEQRMEEGVFNARKLYGEIVAQGYPGGETHCSLRDASWVARTSRLGPLRLDPPSGQAL